MAPNPQMRRMLDTSTEYVRCGVIPRKNGAVFDPTGDVVNIAFTQGTSPQSSDFNTAFWETEGPPYVASILVGPANDGVVLADGVWFIWVMIVDTNEVPILPCGTLEIYSMTVAPTPEVQPEPGQD